MTPNLVVIGVHKSGTTSLFTYLSEHNEIFGATKKEIHYFTPIRYGNKLADIKNYEKYFNGYKNQKYALEASPSYFYGGIPLINKMKSYLGDHKVILILREPKSRFISFYKHLNSKFLLENEDTLEEFFQKSLESVSKNESIKDSPYSRSLTEGNYSECLEEWINAYGKNLKIIYFENLTRNPKTSLQNIANWLEISSNFYENYQFEIINKTVYSKNKFIHLLALWINRKLESFFRRNTNLKKILRNFYFAMNSRKKNFNDTNNKIDNHLNVYYTNPNIKLKRILLKYSLEIPRWL